MCVFLSRKIDSIRAFQYELAKNNIYKRRSVRNASEDSCRIGAMKGRGGWGRPVWSQFISGTKEKISSSTLFNW
jgi:hypothetical protein